MADFEWDPRKASQNRRKHGIEFTTATLIWEGLVLERIDSRRDYGEIRVLTVVYTRRANARRLISARRANSRETSLYEAEISRRKTASTD